MPYDQGNRRRGARSQETVVVEVGGTLGVDLPSVGLGVPTHDTPLSEHETNLITALRPAHLRADLHLAATDWRSVLDRACSRAISTATGLELALFLGPDPEGELKALAAALPVMQARVVRFLVPAVDPNVVRLAKGSLAALAPKASFVGGTAGSDVGREADVSAGDRFDAVACSLSETTDADGGRSLMEPAVEHGEAVRSLQELCPGLPVVVGRVTMARRPLDGAAGSPSEVDPRLWSLFGAAWTLASLVSLARAGASSVTYFETTGPRRVLTEEGVDPGVVVSRPGTVLPLYHVLADVLEWDFGQVGESRSSAPLDVAVLCAHTLDGQRILMANLTNEPRRCSVGRLSAGQVRVRTLDDSSVVTACDDPARFRAQSRQKRTREGALELELAPYAYVRVDV